MDVENKTVPELKEMLEKIKKEANEATREVTEANLRLAQLRLEHDQRVLKLMAIGKELERRSEV